MSSIVVTAARKRMDKLETEMRSAKFKKLPKIAQAKVKAKHKAAWKENKAYWDARKKKGQAAARARAAKKRK